MGWQGMIQTFLQREKTLCSKREWLKQKYRQKDTQNSHFWGKVIVREKNMRYCKGACVGEKAI